MAVPTARAEIAWTIRDKETAELVPATERIVDDLEAFLAILPPGIQQALRARGDVSELIEVVLDLGRTPEARFPGEQVHLSDDEITGTDIQSVIRKVGVFGDDNRAGIPRTLHRISVIRNRAGDPIGLTCRVGRAVFGSVSLIQDLVRTGESILILGRPGVGKTTILREVARVLGDDLGKRVIIVDTSNEIAGDGDVPHPAIGHARRMQVAHTELQHRVMIEAVENHMPEVIIIDEMSTELEALAARTIAERGVQLVATAHGNSLDNLILNPSLSDLVGGTQTVTLGDIEARRRGTQKTVLERAHEPTFGIVIEIRERANMAVHRDVGTVVDLMLRGYPPAREVRWMDAEGEVHQRTEEPETTAVETRPPAFDLRDVQRNLGVPRRGRGGRERGAPQSPIAPMGPASFRRASNGQIEMPQLPRRDEEPAEPKAVRVYLFGIPRATLKQAVEATNARAEITELAEEADFFLTTKAHYNRRPTEVREAERSGVPVYVLRKGTSEQLAEFLHRFRPGDTRAQVAYREDVDSEVAGRRSTGRSPADEVDERFQIDLADSSQAAVQAALRETEAAINRVLAGERKVSLAPQTAFIRRLQHGLASKYNLGSASTGREPGRRVIIRRRSLRR